MSEPQQTDPRQVDPDRSEARTHQAGEGPLSLSVAWGYLCPVLIFLFIFLILIPDADGPSPWDAQAFQSALLELAANFRILDELVDMSIVRAADVGSGFLEVDLDLIGVSNRKFGWAPFFVAIALVAMAISLRALRQAFLAARLGDAALSRGRISSYFFGRGMNLFFPFGAGDFGIAQSLIHNGAAEPVAYKVAFYNRVFDVLAILCFLVASFVYLGWEGALEPIFWGALIVAVIASITHPLGQSAARRGTWNPLAHLWSAFNGRAVVRAVSDLSETPWFVVGASLVSVAALALEIMGYWNIKQAFSSPMDDYVLMKDLRLVDFAIIVVVASLARVLPYTVASLGIYELASVLMFRVFGEGYLAGTTVTLLHSILMNGMTLFLFTVFLWRGRCPQVFEIWRRFLVRSISGTTGSSLPAAEHFGH